MESITVTKTGAFMSVEIPETITPNQRGLQYSLLDLFLYFLAITLLISGYTTACYITVSENTSLYIRHLLPLIVGCFLYLIGTSIRRRMHYSHLTHITRLVLILILLMSSISVCYLLWAYERVYTGKFIFSGLREWPYPDKALLKLASWHESYYPTSMEIIELKNKEQFISHSEPPQVMFARYLFALEIASGPVIAIAAGCVGLLVPFRREWLGKIRLICKRCLHR
jgi:hypothetical protein